MGNIIVGTILLATVATVIVTMIRNKKKGKSLLHPQAPQVEQPHPHEDFPFFLFRIMVTITVATVAKRIVPTMIFPIYASYFKESFVASVYFLMKSM